MEKVVRDTKTANQMRAKLKRAKGEIYFNAFYLIGPERTVKLLHQRVREMGGRVSLKTLERYHKEFHWAQRVMELDAKADAEREKEQIESELERRRFQQRLGRNLSILGQAGIMKYQDLLNKKQFPKLSPADVCRLVETGQKVENLATGDATSRCEMGVAIWNILCSQMARVFLEVNSLRDEGLRRRRFAIRCDEIRTQHLPAIIEGDFTTTA